MNRRVTIIVGLVALTLAGCASQVIVPPGPAQPGFFMGLVHGFIAWFALIGHIFNPEIRIYAVPNIGGWYDFGFLIGVGAWAGGGGAAARG
jgi:hypothetical protein